jgi:uncharacterized protein (TIGR04255 family)
MSAREAGARDRPTRLPVRLQRPPLVEAVFEIRFEPRKETVADLLPGLIYAELKEILDTTEQLPVASIPRIVRQEKDELRYQPLVKISGGNHNVLVGDRVITTTQTPPYDGWRAFKKYCARVLRAVQATELIGAIDRYAFKCINILDLKGRLPTALINGKIELANYPIRKDGLRLRAELEEVDGFITVVELGSEAIVTIGSDVRRGLLISLDTSRNAVTTDFWSALDSHLDRSHDALKRVFFTLIPESVIGEYGPQWEARRA